MDNVLPTGTRGCQGSLSILKGLCDFVLERFRDLQFVVPTALT